MTHSRGRGNCAIPFSSAELSGLLGEVLAHSPAGAALVLIHVQALNLAVVGNEMAAPFVDLPTAEVEQAEAEALILGGSGTSPQGLRELSDVWPAISLPADVLSLPETRHPGSRDRGVRRPRPVRPVRRQSGR